MTSQLAEIPLIDQSYDGEPQPTAVLRGLKKPTSRRSVLRGVAASALTVGALSLTWGHSGRAFAEEGPAGLMGWDRNDCQDAYPGGYDEERDADGEFKDAPGACFGGVISSKYCDGNGWYRADQETRDGGVHKYTPDPTMCSGKHSWKWKTPDGKVYRCSDGTETVTANGGEQQVVFSMCRALVS
ncbi:hypothetical protein AB0L49_46130 [Streptomyces antimycoticus]|uniref:hypothetical protein n=1 Tax=Streptomyces TaxID=1883 RepID=UPI003419885D